MRATIIHKPGDIRVKNVADPKITPGQFVIGAFFASDNTCPICRDGYQTSCPHKEFVGGAQAEYLRVERIRELTGGHGAESVLECVGTNESMRQALRSARPGGNVGFVGVPHGVTVPAEEHF